MTPRKRPSRLLTVCLPIILGGILALALTPPNPSVDYGTSAPDWTYAYCSTPLAQLPAYTHRAVCIDDATGERVAR